MCAVKLADHGGLVALERLTHSLEYRNLRALDVDLDDGRRRKLVGAEQVVDRHQFDVDQSLGVRMLAVFLKLRPALVVDDLEPPRPRARRDGFVDHRDVTDAVQLGVLADRASVVGRRLERIHVSLS